jgi:O-antigen ligase
LPRQHLVTLASGVVIGLLGGAAILMFEAVLGQPMKRFLASIVAILQPGPKHAKVVDGWVTEIGLYTLNRGFAVLILLLWPALLLLKRLALGDGSRFVAGALAAITAVGVASSAHETSMIALALSAIAFLGMRVAPAAMIRLVTAAWIVATLLVAPLAMAAYSFGLHKASAIPETGRNRIILWKVTAERIQKNPMLGIGIESTRRRDEADSRTAQKPQGYSYPLRTGRHAHNVYLQTWYELGAVGALLLMWAGLEGLRVLRSLPLLTRAYGIAAFVAAASLAAFSWGMWQVWFMAAFGLWSLALTIGFEIASRNGSAPETA